MTYRQLGKDALSTVLNVEQNVVTFDKYIYNYSVQQTEDEEEIEVIYTDLIYQLIGDILSGHKLKTILSNIKQNKLGWKHSQFEEVLFRQQEQDDYILNPFNVDEGVVECPKCGGNRTFSYTKQDRSSDEATSVYSTCVKCKYQWRFNS